MAFPKRFSNLPDYAFPRLRRLLDSHAPGGDTIHMTIGEPRHPMPDFVGPVLAGALQGFGQYPPNDGTPELLGAIAKDDGTDGRGEFPEFVERIADVPGRA